jgi:hypothetical protein
MAVPGSLEAIACETAHVGDVIRALRLAEAADAIRARTGMARSGEDEVNYETVAALADEVLEPDVQPRPSTPAGSSPPNSSCLRLRPPHVVVDIRWRSWTDRSFEGCESLEI